MSHSIIACNISTETTGLQNCVASNVFTTNHSESESTRWKQNDSGFPEISVCLLNLHIQKIKMENIL